MPNIKCTGCKQKIPDQQFIFCVECNSNYDRKCSKLTDRRFGMLIADKKASWKCKECCNKLPKKCNDDTGCPQVNISSDKDNSPMPNYIRSGTSTTETISSPIDKNLSSVNPYINESTLRDILNTFKMEIRDTIKKTVKEVVAEKLDEVLGQISGFQESLNFINEQFEDFKCRIDSNNSIVQQLQIENVTLTSSMKGLSDRLNSLEQQLRESNVEINGLTEHRSENLANCLVQLANTVNAPINDEDIMQVTRVAKLDKTSSRPRTVVAKLSSPRVRDTLLAAVQDHNRSNPDNKLNTHHLGLGGTKAAVFVSEHLTPANKSLHAATRLKAKESKYKFVWVRNGRILTRKDETTQPLLIRSTESLKLMM